jgi:undecaprenyl-diphosphatase
MNTVQSIIVAIVEGLTEFLPVSSTGHMIIAEKLLDIQESSFTKVFTVAIQLGAILAVVVLYWKKFFDFKNWQFYVKLFVAVIPALAFGFLFSDKIDALLESALTVAVSLLVGGIVLLFIDNMFNHPTIHSEKEVGYKQAVIIGLWQCVAMVPGVSRSAASIIGGMQQKLTRSAAAEFSFFLAVYTSYTSILQKWVVLPGMKLPSLQLATWLPSLWRYLPLNFLSTFSKNLALESGGSTASQRVSLCLY